MESSSQQQLLQANQINKLICDHQDVDNNNNNNNNNKDGTKFLEGYHMRQENRKKQYDLNRASKLQQTESINTFWNELKTILHVWNGKLDSIVKDMTNRNFKSTKDNYTNESEQQIGIQVHREILHKLNTELKSLRYHCLKISDPSTVPIASSLNHFVENKFPLQTDIHNHNHTLVVLVVPNELSLNDIRLLHNEFAINQMKLDKILNDYIPKKKFTFMKYRTEIKKRNDRKEQQQQNDDHRIQKVESNNITNQLETEMQILEMNDVIDTEVENGTETKHNVISGYHSDHIMIDEPMQQSPPPTRSYNDHVDNLHYDNDSIMDDTMSRSSLSIKNDKQLSENLTIESNNCGSISDGPLASFITLRDMTDCTIEVCGTSYISITLQFIRNSVILLNNSIIRSSIHISNCYGCKIYINQTQQLRIHNSYDLKLYITNSIIAGAILEECQRITFYDNNNCENFSSCHKEYEQKQQEVQKIAHNNHLNVRDFEWMRNGIPSPNYEIINISLKEINSIMNIDKVKRKSIVHLSSKKGIINTLPSSNRVSTLMNHDINLLPSSAAGCSAKDGSSVSNVSHTDDDDDDDEI